MTEGPWPVFLINERNEAHDKKIHVGASRYHDDSRRNRTKRPIMDVLVVVRFALVWPRQASN